MAGNIKQEEMKVAKYEEIKSPFKVTLLNGKTHGKNEVKIR